MRRLAAGLKEKFCAVSSAGMRCASRVRASRGPNQVGLVRSRRSIVAARGRNAIPSDGGGTGKSDGND
ncbi:hypothetical protein [Streptomyces sp. NPDC056628]|uniref:hypothetical protein n=1 Tax=Streptomyces sp. NPDC056628 TaxID=3345882 RepID=UPI0036B31736